MLMLISYELSNGTNSTNTIMALSTTNTTLSEQAGERYKAYYNPPFFYRYNIDKYPAKETTRLYNSAGQYREYFTNRTYNDYGDLLEYTDKLGHKTSNQYESKFHQLDYETEEFDSGVT